MEKIFCQKLLPNMEANFTRAAENSLRELVDYLPEDATPREIREAKEKLEEVLQLARHQMNQGGFFEAASHIGENGNQLGLSDVHLQHVYDSPRIGYEDESIESRRAISSYDLMLTMGASDDLFTFTPKDIDAQLEELQDFEWNPEK